MALTVVRWLADVEGTLCVAEREPDFAEPRYVITYWPLKWSTRVFTRHFEIEPAELRAGFTVRKAMPGCYYIYRDRGYSESTMYADLVNGGKTTAVKVEYAEVPVPRVGKGTKREWDSGRWRIYPPKGKTRTVEV